MRIAQLGSSAVPDMVLYSRVSAWQWGAALCIWGRGKNFQKSLRAEILAKNEHLVGDLEFRGRHYHFRGPDSLESLQQLCAGGHALGVLADDVNVWDGNQEILE